MPQYPTTYSAERTSDGTGWMVIERKWRKGRRHESRPRPIERLLRTFHGVSAEAEAYALVNKKMAKSGHTLNKRRIK